MPNPFELHHLARRGDLPGIRELLAVALPREEIDINGYDNHGYTPLMYAVEGPEASVELVSLLLEHGGDIHQECTRLRTEDSVMSLCLKGGDPQKVDLLIEHGADIHYRRSDGYDALIDSVHGRDVLNDPHLMTLLLLLIAHGVALNGITTYQESGLRVLSRIGRFDAVQLLLDSGADETQLEWHPLIRAVALGSLADVQKAFEIGGDLEKRDWWSRTAWVVAVQCGDVAKARFLAECGADTTTRGRCGKHGSFGIEKIDVRGEPPGWIYKHRAFQNNEGEIRISGGQVVSMVDGKEAYIKNDRCFILDIKHRVWRIARDEPEPTPSIPHRQN